MPNKPEKSPIKSPLKSDNSPLLIVYTGDGKGKTTAALGMAMRAIGRGRKVAVVQFIKGKWPTGEEKFSTGNDNIDFFVMGRGFTWDSDDLEKDKALAMEGWEKAVECLTGGEYDLIILDELTYCFQYKFLDLDIVIDVLKDRTKDVVVTGRNAPTELIDICDTATEMKQIKHAFDSGKVAKKGVDY